MSGRTTCILATALVCACGGEEDILETGRLFDMVRREPGAGGYRRFNTSGPSVVFVNFDGGAVTKGVGIDSAKNTTGFAEGTVPAFSRSQAERDQIMNELRTIFAPYNVKLVTTRPVGGLYNMVMVGGTPKDVGITDNVAGLAPLDCDNLYENDVAFAFSKVHLDVLQVLPPSELTRLFVKYVAETIGHELGHTYGMEHNGLLCDLMNATATGYSCTQLSLFQDKDTPLLVEGRVGCGPTTQNTHKIMLAAAGAAPPDTTPPTVVIDQPADLQQVQGSVTVSATITDDRGVARADVTVDGVVAASKSAPDYTFPLEDLQPGPRQIVVLAVDAAGNQGSAKVRVTVDAAQPQVPSQPEAPSQPQAPSNPAAPPQGPNEIAIVGACSVSGETSSPPVVLLLVLFGALAARWRPSARAIRRPEAAGPRRRSPPAGPRPVA
jgi:hypothetical protein